jgi:hypothetical protein
MPIVIQELLASDTLSQAVDKVNFNFDQLLLNGGGPVGPAGIQGPTGPVGGRGIRGATWYDGSADPNTLIIAGIDEDDYFLQTNGQVWQYNGTVWIQTPVNLTGPTGATGSSVGFDYVGGYNGVNPPTSINNENVAFVVPMPAGVSGGANQLTNQGVSTILLGAVGSTVNPPAGITYSSAFQIPDTMAVQLDASLVSVLIHQKDSSSSAIRFMGGGDDINDKYEQTVLSNLSNITLGIDDVYNINVPKAATSPTSLAELIGFNVNTIRRGQQFYAGKQINFITGADGSPSGFAGEISDVTFTVNTSNPSTPAKFAVATTFASSTALFEVGGNITVNPTTTRNGIILLEAGSVNLTSSTEIRLRHNAGNGISLLSTAVNISGVSGPVNILTGSGQNINITSDAAMAITATTAMQIQSPVSINVFSSIITNAANQINLNGVANTHWLRVDNASVTSGGIKLQGNVTWGAAALNNPLNTVHRNISIWKDSGLSISQSPVYIHRFGTDLGNDLMIDLSRSTGGGPSTAYEYNRLSPTATDILNTSGRAGFVGHTVENSSTAMGAANVGFRLRGIDRSGGNQAVGTKFHASEDTTAVFNRMQYVRKVLSINPLTAGITSGTNYTIPATSMDCSFLDIYVGWDGRLILTTPNNSHNEFSIFIPNGSYVGQRLNIHIIAAPCAYVFPGNSDQVWPNVSFGQFGKVWLRTNSWLSNAPSSPSTNGYLVELRVGRAASGQSVFGTEAYIELVWIGQGYTQASQYDDALNPINLTTITRGWIAVNGAMATNIGLSGNAGVMQTNAFVEFT